jgi:hypothetical protein
MHKRKEKKNNYVEAVKIKTSVPSRIFTCLSVDGTDSPYIGRSFRVELKIAKCPQKTFCKFYQENLDDLDDKLEYFIFFIFICKFCFICVFDLNFQHSIQSSLMLHKRTVKNLNFVDRAKM